MAKTLIFNRWVFFLPKILYFLEFWFNGTYNRIKEKYRMNWTPVFNKILQINRRTWGNIIERKGCQRTEKNNRLGIIYYQKRIYNPIQHTCAFTQGSISFHQNLYLYSLPLSTLQISNPSNIPAFSFLFSHKIQFIDSLKIVL